MAVPDSTAHVDLAADELTCYCCGQRFKASEITRFDQHPGDGVCARCAAWLHNGGQPGPPRRVWRRHHRGRWRRE